VTPPLHVKLDETAPDKGIKRVYHGVTYITAPTTQRAAEMVVDWLYDDDARG
jgi:hypothetical protein